MRSGHINTVNTVHIYMREEQSYEGAHVAALDGLLFWVIAATAHGLSVV
jgi:hypothetical protein